MKQSRATPERCLWESYSTTSAALKRASVSRNPSLACRSGPLRRTTTWAFSGLGVGRKQTPTWHRRANKSDDGVAPRQRQAPAPQQQPEAHAPAPADRLIAPEAEQLRVAQVVHRHKVCAHRLRVMGRAQGHHEGTGQRQGQGQGCGPNPGQVKPGLLCWTLKQPGHARKLSWRVLLSLLTGPINVLCVGVAVQSGDASQARIGSLPAPASIATRMKPRRRFK